MAVFTERWVVKQLQYEFGWTEVDAGSWVKTFIREAPVPITEFHQLLSYMGTKRKEVADAIVLINKCKGRPIPSALDDDMWQCLKPFIVIQREAWAVQVGKPHKMLLNWSVHQIERVLVEVGQSLSPWAPRDARRFMEEYMLPGFGLGIHTFKSFLV